MEHSVFLAKIIGLVLIIASISMFIAKANYKALIKDLIINQPILILNGYFNLIIGLLIVISHNVWQPSWQVLITIIGWLLVIRGVIWTTFPQIVNRVAPKFLKSDVLYYISLVVMLILGIILTYFGFYAK